MDKDKKIVYLFTRRWDVGRVHDWQRVGFDVLKGYIEYTCKKCGMPYSMYSWNLEDTKGHKQLMNFEVPKCE